MSWSMSLAESESAPPLIATLWRGKPSNNQLKVAN